MKVLSISLTLLSLLAVKAQARVVQCTDDTQIYPSGFTRSPCYQEYIKALVVFGDSWTENGDAPLNASSYTAYNFDGRATNGPTWAEYLSASRGFDLYDFAIAGATANNSNLPRPVPDVLTQVETYKEYRGNASSSPFSSTLYSIWVGVNDVHDTYTNVQAEGRDGVLATVANSILTALDTLYRNEGARRFLVPLTPPIGYLPILTNGSSTADHDQADMLAQNLNRLVVDRLEEFYGSHNDAEIITFDSYNLLMSIIQNPAAYNVVSGTEACENSEGSRCSEPDQYLWWDGWHPTTKVESLFADILSGYMFKGRSKNVSKKYVKSFKY